MKAKKDTKQLLFENMVKLNPGLKLTPKGRLLAKPRLNESDAFNDAGEPLMTHQQYNAYSEPSEPEFDDRDDYEREPTFNDVVKALEKHFNTILDHYGDSEYTFLTTREVPGDMMVWIDNNHVGAIGPDDKKFPEQHVEELDINDLIQFFEPYRQYIIIGQDAAKEMNSRSQQASADRNYERQERAAMGGLGEEVQSVKYRADVAGVRENTWSTNAKEYDTEEEAKAALDNLASRWFGFDMSRVVPSTTPRNQPIDMQNDVIYQNMRKMNESPMFGGQKVSQDQYDELQYDKSTMEKAMGDAFKTPEGYQMKHPVKGGESIQLKDGDVVKVMGIDQATGYIKVRVIPADEETKKYYKNGYFDIMWTPVQFDTIVGSEPINEDSDFQQKIANGDVWLEHYGPSGSSEYTDGETWYNRSGQQLRDPEEYNPHSDGYTPFGDESVNKLAENRRIKKDKKTLLFENIVKLNPDLKLNENGGLSEAKPISEDINIDVEVGDTVMMGKFKNSPTVVKSIGKDEHGMPTINGKKAVTFRKSTEKNKK